MPNDNGPAADDGQLRGPGALFYDDIEVGDRWESSRRTLTEADLVNFSGVSGDFNPIHVDEPYAAAGPFGRRIVHGFLVLSVATGLRQQMGIFMGTIKALLELRSWRFSAPVFIGDTVHVVTTVQAMRKTSDTTHGLVVQRVEIYNQGDDLVQSGEFVTLMWRATV